MNDERQERNAGAAAQIVLAVLMIGIVGYLGVQYVRTREIGTWPIVLLLGVGGLFWLVNRMISGAEPPKSVLGRELPTSPESRPVRLRSYALDAALLAGALAVLTLVALQLGDRPAFVDAGFAGLSGVPLLAALAAVELVGGGLVFFGFNLLVGESQARLVERREALVED